MKTPEEERRRRNWCQPHCVGPRGAPGGGFPRSRDRAHVGLHRSTRPLSCHPGALPPHPSHDRQGQTRSRIRLLAGVRNNLGGKEEKELRTTRGWGGGRVEMEKLKGCSPSRSVRLLTFPSRGHRRSPWLGLASVGEGGPTPQARGEEI